MTIFLCCYGLKSHLDLSGGQIFGGAEAVDHARLCFLLFSLLGDSGTVSDTCTGTASSGTGDCSYIRDKI